MLKLIATAKLDRSTSLIFAAQEVHSISLSLVRFLPLVVELTQVLPLKIYRKLKFYVPFSILFIVFNSFIEIELIVYGSVVFV